MKIWDQNKLLSIKNIDEINIGDMIKTVKFGSSIICSKETLLKEEIDKLDAKRPIGSVKLTMIDNNICNCRIFYLVKNVSKGYRICFGE